MRDLSPVDKQKLSDSIQLSQTSEQTELNCKMNGFKPLVALLLVGVCFVATMQAAEGENKTTKMDKQPLAREKLQQAKTAEVAATKLRVASSLSASGSGDKLSHLSTASRGLDLMTAAGEKKYMLVKKKPKHKKIKMEVFKPKMKYKKIKMKIPVKKMKKKKVKGYLVKKEHGHGHEY